MCPHCPVKALNRLLIAVAVIVLLLAASSPCWLQVRSTQPPALNLTFTALSISPNPSVVGENVTLTAKVTGVTGGTGGGITGTVTFMDGSTQLGTPVTLDSSGTATYSSTSFAEGSHPITASYSGDANNAPSTSPVVTLVVNPMGSQQSSTTSLKISPNPAQVGQTITFTAKVTGGLSGSGQVTGNVIFYNGSDALATVILDASGTATYKNSTLAVGTYTITAAYSGDGNFLPSTSPPVTLMVVPVGVLTPTTTTLTSSAPNANFGDTVIFSATVSGGMGNPPTGTVTFLDGSSTIGTGTLSNGLATFSTSSLSVGTHTITAQYSGDSNFLSSTSDPLTETIGSGGGGGGGGGTTFYMSVNPGILNVTQGQSGTATVTVSPSGGFNQQITFVCSGLPLYANCSFNPTTITPDGSNKPVTTTLTVTTGGSSARLMPPILHPRGSWPADLLAVFSVGLLGLVQVKGRREGAGQHGAKVRTRATWFLFTLCLVATLWLVACGGSGSKANSVTPKGQTVVTVAGSYSTGGQSTTFTLNVQ